LIAANVGIGTSSPDNKLHVSQASSDFQVRVTGTSAANAGAIRAYNAGGEASVFGTTGSSNTGYGANLGVLGTVTNIPQVFVTNNTERARIDTSGIFSCNLTQSASGNGYVKLPSGIYIQWGSASANTSGVTSNFPVAFPSACWSLVAVNNNQTNPPAPSVTILSTSQFRLTVNAGGPTCYFFAIGN